MAEPGPAEEREPVGRHDMDSAAHFMGGVGLPPQFSRREDSVSVHDLRPRAQAAAEEAVGVHDDDPRLQIEAADDGEGKTIGFAEAEAQRVVRLPERRERRPQHLGAEPEHQPRVAHEKHVRRAEPRVGVGIDAEEEHVVIHLPADIAGEIVVVVAGALRVEEPRGRGPQRRHGVDHQGGAGEQHGHDHREDGRGPQGGWMRADWRHCFECNSEHLRESPPTAPETPALPWDAGRFAL
jgi:hypothetical protein